MALLATVGVILVYMCVGRKEYKQLENEDTWTSLDHLGKVQFKWEREQIVIYSLLYDFARTWPFSFALPLFFLFCIENIITTL